MSNIDKRAQKELYAKVEQQAHSLRGNPREYQAVTGLCPVNVIEMHAQKIQALLDELEAKDVTRSAQDYHFGQQANRIESLERSLEAAEKRTADYRDALNNLAAVARRYLPDYDEHPDIQAADDLLESAAGIGKGR